jgi:hypothetical protein
MNEEMKEGPVQSHDPSKRVWEYDGDGNKIYKLDQGYQNKTPYTEEHWFKVGFWKGRQ